MSVNFDLNNYKNKDGYYDFDSMKWDIETLLRLNKASGRTFKNGEEVYSVKQPDYLKSEEYKQLMSLEQNCKEEIELVKIKYKNMIIELQNKCEHYPAMYKGKKICLKCKMEM